MLTLFEEISSKHKNYKTWRTRHEKEPSNISRHEKKGNPN